MGMFDNITVKWPLPLPEFQDNNFQTKSAPNPRDGYCHMDTLTINEIGQLLRSEWEGFETADGEPCPHHFDVITFRYPDDHEQCRPAWSTPTPEPFEGNLYFYNTVGLHGWIEFVARFNGICNKIDLVEHRRNERRLPEDAGQHQ